ncbi:MAG: helix-hairpin-helix domain-containing protein [Sedimenticolaceae bacterium]|nr:helix-hairpin-helix domain-containing protein [Sedimenticolaceae bacterium]
MDRSELKVLRDIPNIGVATERMLFGLGVSEPADLIGKDPYQLYDNLCRLTGKKQDPCVLDVLIAAVTYMEGGPARKWWEFTQERKQRLASQQSR